MTTTLQPAPAAPRVLDAPVRVPHRWARLLLSLAVAAMGLINLASALLSHPPDRLLALRGLLPTPVLDTSRTFTLLAGALLLVTAWGLRRGKRRGYVLALLLCAVSVPVHLLKALDIEEATIATSLMLALALNADAFRVRSRSLSATVVRSGALWGALALLLYMLAGSWALGARFGIEPSLGRAFADAAHHMFGIGERVVLIPEPLAPAAGRVVTWYLRSLPLLALVWITGTALALLAPATHRGRHRAEAGRVKDLVLAHGVSGVSWFAHEDPEADYYFSANGRAVIAYRFVSDVALVIGDPIGPPEERASLLESFASWCAGGDWTFGIYQATPEMLPLYRSLGWRPVHIGEEPILDPAHFTLDGGVMGDVRRSARKATEAGLEVRHFRPGDAPLPRDWTDALRAISSQWLAHRQGPEFGFCMGRFDAARLGDVWTAVAWNRTLERVEGFVTWTPVPARRGWALDLMRRRDDAMPGTMEKLIVESVHDAQRAGDAQLSLSLSALAHVTEPPAGAPAVAERAPKTRPAFADPERAREFLVTRLARFYDFHGVFQWKKKFDPRFEDRYLVVPSPASLPAVAVALARVQIPGGLSGFLKSALTRRNERA
jgi:phosphatidylglycerol lysyltransferase